MTHKLYEVLNSLDEGRLWYRLSRNRPGSVMITVTLVGERIEIDVFEDGHIEYSNFRGSEEPKQSEEEIAALFERLRAEISS